VSPASWTQFVHASGSTKSLPGSVSRRQQQVDFRAEPPLDTSTSRSVRLGELIGELHDDAPAERLPDEP